MNREIKFRAWAKYSKEMFYPAEEFYCMNGVLTTLPNTVLMQFTGLLDKNGKEIYEGDIVNHIVRKDDMFVTWEQSYKEQPGFVLKNTKGDTLVFGLGKPELVEVIGNIYESPELLKS